jgi:hypothetical protein
MLELREAAMDFVDDGGLIEGFDGRPIIGVYRELNAMIPRSTAQRPG